MSNFVNKAFFVTRFGVRGRVLSYNVETVADRPITIKVE